MANKTYIVYDSSGHEQGYLKSSGHNEAEVKAKARFGPRASVSYTELGKEFDHVRSGFFNDEQARVANKSPYANNAAIEQHMAAGIRCVGCGE